MKNNTRVGILTERYPFGPKQRQVWTQKVREWDATENISIDHNIK